MIDLYSSDYAIRYTEERDESFLRNWILSPGMLHWFPMRDASEVENALSVWIWFSRFKSSLTATWRGVPIGIATLYLMPYQKIAHHALFKIIVDPQFQRQGVGGSLIRNCKRLARDYFNLEVIHAEVFEGNPLIPLLKKNGFYEYVSQDSYVKEEGGYLSRHLLELDLRDPPRLLPQKKEIVLESVKERSFAPSPELSVRLTEQGDAKALTEWLSDDKVLRWFPVLGEREIADTVRVWVGFSSMGSGLTALWNGEPCGMAVLNIQYFKKLAHACLVSIIVSEKVRNRGVGTFLLQELEKLAVEKFHIELLHLEVYEGNPAIRLYQREGYVPYGVERDFVKEQGQYLEKIMMQKRAKGSYGRS